MTFVLTTMPFYFRSLLQGNLCQDSHGLKRMSQKLRSNPPYPNETKLYPWLNSEMLSYGNSSFHFLFHYPYITPIYTLYNPYNPSSFHFLFHYPNINPLYNPIWSNQLWNKCSPKSSKPISLPHSPDLLCAQNPSLTPNS